MTPKTENVPRLLMICSKFIDDDFDFFLSEYEPMPLLSTNGNFRKISKLRTAVDPFFIIIALSGEVIGPGLNGVRLRGAGLNGVRLRGAGSAAGDIPRWFVLGNFQEEQL